MEKAVITVVGKDTVGILAKVSGRCADYSINVIEVTQSVLTDLFAMIMIVDVKNSTKPFGAFVEEMKELGNAEGLEIHVMHEDIFNAMHKI